MSSLILENPNTTAVVQQSQDTQNTGNLQADKRLEHIKSFQWAPGVSGNPGGRPKGSKNLSKLLAEAIEAEITLERDKEKITKTGGQWIIDSIMASAISGDQKAQEMVFERMEGSKPLAQIITQNINSNSASVVGPEQMAQLSEAFAKWQESQKS